MNAVSIRALEERDLDAALAIVEAARPLSSHWPRESYLPAPDDVLRSWVAVCNGAVAGVLLAGYAGDDVEILNLAVADAARRHGVGRALVRVALDEAIARGLTRAFLEVRESNAGARAFYARLGFTDINRRRGYYRDPEEDGLVLGQTLPGRAG